MAEQERERQERERQEAVRRDQAVAAYERDEAERRAKAAAEEEAAYQRLLRMSAHEHIAEAARIVAAPTDQQYVNRMWLAAQTHLQFAIAKQGGHLS